MHITVKYVPYKIFPPQQKCQKENKDESFKVNNNLSLRVKAFFFTNNETFIA